MSEKTKQQCAETCPAYQLCMEITEQRHKVIISQAEQYDQDFKDVLDKPLEDSVEKVVLGIGQVFMSITAELEEKIHAGIDKGLNSFPKDCRGPRTHKKWLIAGPEVTHCTKPLVEFEISHMHSMLEYSRKVV